MRKYGLKIISLLLSTVIVFALFPSWKSYAGTHFEFDENTGTLTISYTGSGNSELTWDSLLDYDFELSDLKVVIIEEGITSIGEKAFKDCDNLTEVSIPTSVTSIGESAFYGCSSLEKVNIPNGITSINDYTFGCCFSLSDITIPESVTSIGYAAFTRCTSLTEVTIPNKVTSIGNFAFNSCNNLASVSIPDSVISIGEGAFDNCFRLKTVTIPESVTSLGDKVFSNCTDLTDIVMSLECYENNTEAFMYVDSKFHFYYYANFSSLGHGTIQGNETTYGTDKLTVVSDANYEVDQIVLKIDDNNEIVGFSGRSLIKDDMPLYLTRRSPIVDEDKCIFGLDEDD